jgi:hypothetical protein
MSSKNNKTIEVIGFRFVTFQQPKDQFYLQCIMYNDVSLHSTLVQKYPTDNSFIFFSSEYPIPNKSFVYSTDNQKIEFWFEGIDGQLVDFTRLPDNHLHIQLKLTY